MATYRVHATKNYTVMSNTHLRDKNMSLKAKGLLSVMLSLPDTWDYSINGLVAICKENNTAVESALKELKKLGYLIVIKKMPGETASGRIEYEYNIYETPQEAAAALESSTKKQAPEKQDTEKQGVENLGLEFQGVENKGQLITKELNTNKSITKELNKEIYKNVVEYLNEKTGSKFRSTTKDTQKHINGRLSEGFTEKDFYIVIDKQVANWTGTEWARFLVPSTLFGPKFEKYLNAQVYERRQYGAAGVEIAKPVSDEEDLLAGIL